jgi:hypothetical protein
MYKNIVEMMFAEINLSPAVLFMNSNKAKHNLRKIIKEIRRECRPYGIELQHECIVNKGPDRDIDREAVNMLISLLITGKYKIVVVNKMTDLTTDLFDLDEFTKDASDSGIHFFELATKQFYFHTYSIKVSGEERTLWD